MSTPMKVLIVKWPSLPKIFFFSLLPFHSYTSVYKKMWERIKLFKFKWGERNDQLMDLTFSGSRCQTALNTSIWSLPSTGCFWRWRSGSCIPGRSKMFATSCWRPVPASKSWVSAGRNVWVDHHLQLHMLTSTAAADDYFYNRSLYLFILTINWIKMSLSADYLITSL